MGANRQAKNKKKKIRAQIRGLKGKIRAAVKRAEEAAKTAS